MRHPFLDHLSAFRWVYVSAAAVVSFIFCSGAAYDHDWKDLLIPTGALFGIFITQWTIFGLKQRELLDTWWEEYAIINGLSPIIDYLNCQATRISRDDENQTIDPPTFPEEAYRHISVLFMTGGLSALMSNADKFHQATVSEDYRSEFVQSLNIVSAMLHKMIKLFYQMHLTSKADIYHIRNHPEAQQLFMEIEIFIRGMREMPFGSVIHVEDAPFTLRVENGDTIIKHEPIGRITPDKVVVDVFKRLVNLH